MLLYFIQIQVDNVDRKKIIYNSVLFLSNQTKEWGKSEGQNWKGKHFGGIERLVFTEWEVELKGSSGM